MSRKHCQLGSSYLNAGPLSIILSTLQARAPYKGGTVGQQLLDERKIVI